MLDSGSSKDKMRTLHLHLGKPRAAIARSLLPAESSYRNRIKCLMLLYIPHAPARARALSVHAPKN